jgi:hypothetical protein
MEIRTFEGSCHCGKVRFRVATSRNQVVVCNCSVCHKKGARLLRVTPEELELLAGDGNWPPIGLAPGWPNTISARIVVYTPLGGLDQRRI